MNNASAFYVMCQGRRSDEPPARRVSPPLRSLSEAARVMAYLRRNWQNSPPLFIEQDNQPAPEASMLP